MCVCVVVGGQFDSATVTKMNCSYFGIRRCCENFLSTNLVGTVWGWCTNEAGSIKTCMTAFGMESFDRPVQS